jgi:hypothetical protein
MTHKVKRIVDRFAELKTAIQETALRDTKFRVLCEDYDTVADVIAFWSRSPDVRGPMIVREYAVLLEELEAEIFTRLRRPH